MWLALLTIGVIGWVFFLIMEADERRRMRKAQEKNRRKWEDPEYRMREEARQVERFRRDEAEAKRRGEIDFYFEHSRR
jgi:hypothetical protein